MDLSSEDPASVRIEQEVHHATDSEDSVVKIVDVSSDITNLALNSIENSNEIKAPNPEGNAVEDNSASPVVLEENGAEVDEVFLVVEENASEVAYAAGPPPVDFKANPYQITGVWKEFEHATMNNFTKGCKWAPDGSCMLTCSDDAKLRVFNLPPELWQMSINWENISEMKSALCVSEPEIVYDYCWYSRMSTAEPVTSCFASTARANPVHLWDAFTGELRCTYRAYNHVDEVVAAHSVAFNTDGQKLYCGFKNIIRVFNVSIPGRKFEEIRTCDKRTGQRGIVSCFAFCAEGTNVFAAGSYGKTVGLYSESDRELIHLIDQQKGGVTHMLFSPDGSCLYTGGRKDNDIWCFDLRDLTKPLFCLRRLCSTNQRMYFDISRCGRYIASGNNNGVISIWDVQHPRKEICVYDDIILEPTQFYQAHKDCANGVSFHPYCPLLATSSGQRKFPDILDSEGEEQEDGRIFTDKYLTSDNSVRLWWIGPSL